MGKNRKKIKKVEKDNLTIYNEDLNEDCEGSVRQYKPLPNKIEKGAYETQEQFMKRLNKLVGKAMCEAEIESKFNVDFCKKTGKNEFDITKSLSAKKQERRKERDRKRKLKKNLKKQLQKTDFSQIKDKISFGEIIHQPPNLEKIKKKFDEQIRKRKLMNKI